MSLSNEIIRTRNKSKRNSIEGIKNLDNHEFVTYSLGFIPRDHPIRKICLRTMKNKWFNRFILFLILINSLLLAMTDYKCIDQISGKPSSRCWRNKIGENSEIIFLVLFTSECVIKIIAAGLAWGNNTYLSDSWNILDFIVVISGLISLFPDISSNISTLRTIRILRPLRSLSALPGLRLLIASLLSSIKALLNVLLLLGVVFGIFGILGIQLWSGLFNFRCRMTPFPLKLESKGSYPPSPQYLEMIMNDPEKYRCLNVPNDNNTLLQSESPWHTPQDCFWPIADEILRLCTNSKDGYKCPSMYTCGSNYDYQGNARFVNFDSNGDSLFLMEEASHLPEFNFGITTFDNFPTAFVTMFQAITMEGWTIIMFMVQDSYSAIIGAILFCFLILFASFFLLNLTLAVIWEEFDKSSKKFSKELEGSGYLSKLMSTRDASFESNNSSMIKAEEKQNHIIHRFVTSLYFNNFILILIVFNTVILSLDHHPMDLHFEQNLEKTNFILSLAFTIEMILKISGHGLKGYTMDILNIFDAVIVIVSLIELIILPPTFLGGQQGVGGGALSVLRTFRLFRIFKLARNWSALQKLLATIIKTLGDVANFAILLFLFMFIYALIGMRFFANTLHFHPETDRSISFAHELFNSTESPRAHFDGFFWSFATVFQILTGENWNSVMYDCWRGMTDSYVAAIYFISLVCLGDWITMNLFLAILLGNFDNMEELSPSTPILEKTQNIIRKLSSKQKSLNGGSLKIKSKFTKENMEAKQNLMSKPENNEEEKQDSLLCGDNNSHSQEKISDNFEDEDNPSDSYNSQLVVVKPSSNGRSLFLFDSQHPLRYNCRKLIESPWFDQVILFLIFCSGILLAIDNPLFDPNSTTVKILNVLDFAFTIIFTLEMIVKVISMGLIVGNGTYLRNAWNLLDFFIVLISIIPRIVPGNSAYKSLRSLRTLRAFRPLRVISRQPGLKLVVNALISSLPSIANVLFLCALFLLIFSIIGINYFKGRFMACQGNEFNLLPPVKKEFLINPPSDWRNNDTYTDWMSSCPSMNSKLTSRDVCECWNLNWEPTTPQNFDNVVNAMCTLFELSTTEGWVDVMYAGVDSVDIDMQPVRDNNELWVLFFVLYMIIGSFFVTNLFVGIVIDNFNQMKDKLDEVGGGMVFMTEAQKLWVKTYKASLMLKPIFKPNHPKGAFRSKVFTLISSKNFEIVIISCIFINSFVLALQQFGQSDEYSLTLDVFNYIFAFIFTGEAILKLVALGIKQYFLDDWNKFDFTIVCGTNMGLLWYLIIGSGVGSIVVIVRIFRIGRIFRLIHGCQSLRQIFNTLICTLPSLANIGSLLLLLFFIYAIMGVQLFANVGFNGALNEHTNFQSFGAAMTTLMGFSTGENWNGFMYDVIRGYDNGNNCIENRTYDSTMCGYNNSDDCIPLDGCGNRLIVPYSYTFTILITFVMLNLFIAVILEGFSEMSEDDVLLTGYEYKIFQDEWKKFDPKATGFIAAKQASEFLHNIFDSFPILRRYMTKDEFHNRIYSLTLPLFETKCVQFTDVMRETTDIIVKCHASSINEDTNHLEIEKFYDSERKLSNLKKKKMRGTNNEDWSLTTYYAAQKVQAQFQKYRNRKETDNQS